MQMDCHFYGDYKYYMCLEIRNGDKELQKIICKDLQFQKISTGYC